ncbi:hypothetical protein CP8484711_2003B, partial [Chlamydia psittaci 84-8471/1]
RLQINA